MRSATILLLLLIPLLVGASAPFPSQQAIPLDAQLRRARAEQAAAERDAAKLDAAAHRAQGDLARLRAEEAASAQAIEAAEARITAADVQVRLASAYVAAHRAQLAAEQRPVSSLLAGIALMGRRPPLLAIAGGGNSDELVKVRILLNATLPIIRARTARLSAQLSDGRKLEQEAVAARAEVVRSRHNLTARRAQFAVLEQKASQLAQRSGAQALSAGDLALAAGETVEDLGATEARNHASATIAAQLASADAAPARPTVAQGRAPALPFAYELPAIAPVTEGLSFVNGSGVRARGITLATFRGAPVSAPASGTVRFSGPYRDYDGVLIIDHGGGWMTLLVNVASTMHAGDRVELGQAVGRALGPLQVELSQSGRRISPALIAGSSQSLSNAAKGG